MGHDRLIRSEEKAGVERSEVRNLEIGRSGEPMGLAIGSRRVCRSGVIIKIGSWSGYSSRSEVGKGAARKF